MVSETRHVAAWGVGRGNEILTIEGRNQRTFYGNRNKCSVT